MSTVRCIRTPVFGWGWPPASPADAGEPAREGRSLGGEFPRADHLQPAHFSTIFPRSPRPTPHKEVLATSNLHEYRSCTHLSRSTPGSNPKDGTMTSASAEVFDHKIASQGLVFLLTLQPRRVDDQYLCHRCNGVIPDARVKAGSPLTCIGCQEHIESLVSKTPKRNPPAYASTIPCGTGIADDRAPHRSHRKIRAEGSIL